MRRVWPGLAALLLAAGLAHARQPDGPAVEGLADFVLRAARPAGELRPLAAESACVRDYLSTLPAASPLWRDPPDSPGRVLPARRARLAAQIEWLLGARVRREARAFTAAFPLYTEWEGLAEAPLAEARFVRDWLAQRPDSALATFLHLLETHRLIAALAAPDLDPALRLELLRQAREARQRALAACRQLDTRQAACLCIVDELQLP